MRATVKRARENMGADARWIPDREAEDYRAHIRTPVPILRLSPKSPYSPYDEGIVNQS